MTTNRRTARGVFIEAAVIVASILLAFSVDAAWDRRGEIAETEEALRAVAEELEQNLSYFENVESVYESSAEAAFGLLEMTGPSPVDVDGEVISLLIGDMWKRPGIEPPSSGAIETMVSAGTLGRIESGELRRELALWPSFIARQTGLADLLASDQRFHERMLLYVAQLDFDRIGGNAVFPEVQQRFRDLAPQASRFSSDWAGLLADRQFESGVVSRSMGALAGAHLARETQSRIRVAISLIRAEME
jgi:hypothetical protein